MDGLFFIVVVGGYCALVYSLINMFNIKKAFAPFAALCIIICFDFFSGMLRVLNIGAFCLIVVSYLLCIYCFFRSRKTIKEKEGNESFVFICIAISITFISCFIAKKVFINPDDMGHWAIAYKVMKTENDFYTFYNLNIPSFSYPPALQILWYHFTLGQKEIHEWLIFAVNNSAWFICLATAFCKVNGKIRNSLHFVFMSIALIASISVFGGLLPFTNSLFAEPFMAVTFASLLFIYFMSEQINKQTFILLILGSAILTLTKDFGMILAFCLAGIILLDTIFQIFSTKGKNKCKDFIKPISSISILMLLPLSLWIIWNAIIPNINSGNSIARIQFVSKNTTNSLHQTAINSFVKNFITALHKTDIGFYTVITAVSLICIVIYIQNKFSAESLKLSNRSLWALLLGFIISVFVHLIALSWVYMIMFKQVETDNLAQYDRYLSPIIMGYLIFAVCFCISNLILADKVKCMKGYRYSEIICLIIFALIVNRTDLTFTPFFIEYNNKQTFDDSRQKVRKNIDSIKNNLRSSDFIFVIAQGDCRGIHKGAMIRQAAQFEYYPYIIATNYLYISFRPLRDKPDQDKVFNMYDREYYTYYSKPEEFVKYIKDTGATKVLVIPTDRKLDKSFKQKFSDRISDYERNPSGKLYKIVDNKRTPFLRIK